MTTSDCEEARCSTAPLLRICVAIALVLHAAMLAWEADRDAPTVDEVAYLAAGLSHWQFGRFDLANVSPPLVRLIAAVPVLLLKPQYDWHTYESRPGARVAHTVGCEFMMANGARTFWLFTIGRLACIPFSLIGACVCFRWARDLYGDAPGLLALCLWCFSPAILGNGAFLAPDVGVSSLAIAAGYTFWRWLKTPSWSLTLVAGFTLGLAELAKTNTIVFFVLWPTLWATFRVGNRSVRFAPFQRLLIVLVLALYVLNVGYGFEGSFRSIRSFTFQSQFLAGTGHGGNRFASCLVGHLPAPVPENYLLGIDAQRADFENVYGQRKSYVRGEWHEHGWWWFYLYVLAVKAPLGTWGLFCLAIVVRFRRSFQKPKSDPKRVLLGEGAVSHSERTVTWEDDLTLLAPAGCLFLLASSQNGFSHHLRYLLPAFPFAWIWISQTATTLISNDSFHGDWQKRLVPCGVSFMATWSIVSSLWIWPHSLAYFNEIAGGPCKGDFHLQESNIDWGEDLLYLRQWIEKHPDAQPLYIAYWGIVDPKLAGIDGSFPDEPVKPGWYVISVKRLRGDARFGPTLESWLSISPVDRIGYSIRVYHIRSRG